MRANILLIGDTHGRTSKFSSDRVDVIACLGDLVDEDMFYSSRKKYLHKLSDTFDDLNPSMVFVVPGNHERICNEAEKLYCIMDSKQKSKIRSIRNPTGVEKAMLKIDEFPEKLTYSLLGELGHTGDYATYSDEKDKEIFAAYTPIRFPKHERNTKYHFLSHHQNSKHFVSKYGDYFHGHRHNLYENGDKISTGIFKRDTKQRWKLKRSFAYRLRDGKISKSKRHTPGIFFFLENHNAKVEIIPGIFGDWMLYNQKKREVTYWSSITKIESKINLTDLFENLQIKGYKLHF